MACSFVLSILHVYPFSARWFGVIRALLNDDGTSNEKVLTFEASEERSRESEERSGKANSGGSTGAYKIENVMKNIKGAGVALSE